MRTVDTLPPAERNEILEFEGYHGCESHCRMRVYRTTDCLPVIVLTEMPDNPGTSITNRAERAHYLAWRRIGSPAEGGYFIEHYPGADPPWDRVLAQERLAFVQFEDKGSAPPITAPLFVQGQELIGFHRPEWKPLPRWQFDQLIGKGR